MRYHSQQQADCIENKQNGHCRREIFRGKTIKDLVESIHTPPPQTDNETTEMSVKEPLDWWDVAAAGWLIALGLCAIAAAVLMVGGLLVVMLG